MSEKRIVIINGSPRGGEATTSEFISGIAKKKLEAEGAAVMQLTAWKSLKGDAQADFTAMKEADVLIFVFPLYFFCVPGMLMCFMKDYEAYSAQHSNGREQQVYAVVNCGFPEGEINTEAIRVIGSFSSHIGAEFGFGVGIGGGPMIAQTQDAPFMKPLFNGLDEALTLMAKGECGDNVTLSPRIPRWMYFMMGNIGWGQMSHKNGLRKKDLYRAPYAQ
jgi:hypothetical protein